MGMKDFTSIGLIVGGLGIALYYLLAACGCAFTQGGQSNCYNNFHLGTAIFVLSLALSLFGYIKLKMDNRRRGF